MENRPSVSIIDYGMCNMHSVIHAFEAIGAQIAIANKPEDILTADHVVLPGVGAFEDGMKGLAELGFIEPLKQFAATGKPLLGICLGMQMLMDTSEEFGEHRGLGLIEGTVTAIPDTGNNGERHKIPHIGWNELVKPNLKQWDGTIMNDTEEHSSVYFVHSFTCKPESSENRLADAYYNGRLISAAIKKQNIYGCQFHPEKSGKVGLEIISNFLRIR
ncbi:imidazole glycerol phosphate synthase subunit HisH [Cohnella sp. GCM10027633]|uniref:imidazole glycerol phosphate synthase subunit HisH n=1 Tax=unclassified Cohnella TaxID=2636738 RepID=UPI00363E9571